MLITIQRLAPIQSDELTQTPPLLRQPQRYLPLTLANIHLLASFTVCIGCTTKAPVEAPRAVRPLASISLPTPRVPDDVVPKLPTFEDCLPHAARNPDEASAIDRRTMPVAQVRRVQLEQACLEGDMKSCWSVIEATADDDLGMSNVECAATLSKAVCETKMTDWAKPACVRLGIEQLTWPAPRAAEESFGRACTLGEASGCVIRQTLDPSNGTEARLDVTCEHDPSACESAALALEGVVGSETLARGRAALFRVAGKHGRLLSLLRVLGKSKTAFEIAPLLTEPCRRDLVQCGALLARKLEPSESLAVRLALCDVGVRSACRFASLQLVLLGGSSPEYVAKNAQVMQRGCELNDQPTCALQGASLSLGAELGSDQARAAEKLLKQACNDRQHACHKLKETDDSQGFVADLPSIQDDPRFDILLGASCSLAHDPAACDEIERREDSMKAYALPWSRKETFEGLCQAGLFDGCMMLSMEFNNRKTILAACRAGGAGACEAMSQITEESKAHLAFEHKACEFGRCRACANLILDTRAASNLTLLERACETGCKEVCSQLATFYANGVSGLPIDEERARHFIELESL